MFPVFFCFFRYRKARKYALMNYYEGKILPKQINCSTIKYPLENEYILHQPKQLSSPTVLYFSKPIYYVFIGFLVSAFSYFIWDEIYRFIFADIYLLAPTILEYIAIYPRMLSYLLLNTYREMAYGVILVYHLHMPS